MVFTDGENIYRSRLAYIIRYAEERTMPWFTGGPWLLLNPFYILGEQVVGRAMNYAAARNKSQHLKEIPDAVAAKLLTDYLSIKK